MSSRSEGVLWKIFVAKLCQEVLWRSDVKKCGVAAKCCGVLLQRRVVEMGCRAESVLHPRNSSLQQILLCITAPQHVLLTPLRHNTSEKTARQDVPTTVLQSIHLWQGSTFFVAGAVFAEVGG